MKNPRFPGGRERPSRRRFVAGAAALAAWRSVGVLTGRARAADGPKKIIGHGAYRYEVVPGWGKLDPAKVPVANCHEMVGDSKGRLILFQTDVHNNILIYDQGGKLLETWGTTFPGAHGMDLVNENGEEFLFLTDTKLGKVFKTTMKGEVILELGRPKLPQYADPAAKYAPTNVMPSIDGSFYVGDGYGSHWVCHYSHDGELQHVFGGPGKADHHLDTPHGGLVDVRDGNNPTLMICSRGDHALKRFTLSGIHLETIPLPGMRVCQLAARGDTLVAPHLEGLLSVIDRDNLVVSNPGGLAPDYGDQLQLATLKKDEANSPFTHPHGIWIDEEESLYVAQWNSGKTYPIKLKRM